MKLHQKLPTMKLIGLDVSPSMVDRARKNIDNAGLTDLIEIREGNASQMPFADNSFDIIVSTGSIHHWKEPIAALNDAYRVLKHGCHALMFDLVSNTPASILDDMRGDFGRLKTTIFWLHGFEEPIYSRNNFEALTAPLNLKIWDNTTAMFPTILQEKAYFLQHVSPIHIFHT